MKLLTTLNRNNRGSLFKSTSLYAIGNILPQIASFSLLPVYTAYLTPSEFGIVSSMTLLQAFLVIFMTLAIERAVYRVYFDYEESKRKEYLGTITISLLICSIFVACIYLFVIDNLLNQAFESIPFYPYYVYMILISFFSVFSLTPKIYYQVEEKPGKYVIIALLYTCTDLGLRILFISIDSDGARGQLLAMLIASIVFVPLYLIIIFKNFNLNFNKAMFFNSMKFSLPMIPSLLCAWVMNLSDRVFIERYLSLDDVGIYSLGYKIGQVVLMIGSAFLIGYNPIFYKIANSNEANSKDLLRIYNTIFMISISLVAFMVAFFSSEAISLADRKYSQAQYVVPLIAFSYLFSCFTSINNLSIYQVKKTKITMYINFFAAIINFTANYFLIVRYGTYGAAISTCLTFFILFITSYIQSKKHYFVGSNWSKILLFNIVSLTIVLFDNVSIFSNVLIYTLCKVVITTALISLTIYVIRSEFGKLKGQERN